MKSTAFIGNILGNVEALRAVLDDIRSRDIRHVVCVGNITGLGPNPKECLELVVQRCQKMNFIAVTRDGREEKKKSPAACKGLYDLCVVDPSLSRDYINTRSGEEQEILGWTTHVLYHAESDAKPFWELQRLPDGFVRISKQDKTLHVGAVYGVRWSPASGSDIKRIHYGTIAFTPQGDHSAPEGGHPRLYFRNRLPGELMASGGCDIGDAAAVSVGYVNPISQLHDPVYVEFDGKGISCHTVRYDPEETLKKIAVMDISSSARDWLGEKLMH